MGPQHGFARITDWEVMKEDDDCAILKMENNEKTEKMWNFKFSLQYTVRIENNKLFTILTVHNTDDKEFDFTALLHTYFHVDVPSLEVEGFFGMKFTDSLSGNDHEESEKVAKVEKNIDRIYKNVERSQVIKSKMGAVELHRTGLPGKSLEHALAIVFRLDRFSNIFLKMRSSLKFLHNLLYNMHIICYFSQKTDVKITAECV